MLLLAIVLCGAVCGFLWPRGVSPADQRLVRQLDPQHSPKTKPNLVPQKRRRDERGDHSKRREKNLRRTTAVLVALACAAALGGAKGALVGILAGAAVHRCFNRLGQAERRRRRAWLIADLPLAVDLLAACLRGGAPWGEAVEAVARAVGGPLGEELNGVAVRIRLGADPEAAWSATAEEPALAPLARTAIRAVQSGAPPAVPLARLARDQRRTARTAAAARARTAGIMSLAPLGACFLPAFVLLGVVPAIASIASTILLPR
jgi:Flp pilus assembly protein TadB